MMTKQPEYLKILKGAVHFERRGLITQIQIHLKNLFLKRKEILLDSDILENILKAVTKLKRKKYLKKR